MWHGPVLDEALADVTAVLAMEHLVPDAHSIWELVLHIAAWAEIAHARLQGTPWVEPTIDEDWPPVPARGGAAAWNSAKTRATKAYEALADAVAPMSAESLRERVTGQQYTRATMLHGVIEHGVYHIGQIMLLRKV